MGWTTIESWIKGFAEFESIYSFKVTPQIEEKLAHKSIIMQTAKFSARNCNRESQPTLNDSVNCRDKRHNC